MLAEKIREFALARGADLVGFAAADDFGDAPAGFRPRDIMPRANGVVVMANAQPRGTLAAGNQAVYTAQHTNIMKHLDELARAVAVFIETQGYLAVPVPADDPYFHWEEDRRHGAGILSHRHAAVKAGLGAIGRGALLITPQFGNRVELVSILTDAPFTSPAATGDPCPPGCDRCLAACPVGALDGSRSVEQSKCRGNLAVKSARGHNLVKCWLCRAACPAKS
jgi:epoxyqueuosine reductase QueG